MHVKIGFVTKTVGVRHGNTCDGFFGMEVNTWTCSSIQFRYEWFIQFGHDLVVETIMHGIHFQVDVVVAN